MDTLQLNTSNKIEIQLSKSKLALLFSGSAVFVALGIWFVIDPPKINNPIFGNPTTIFIVGLASVVFFGFAGFFIFKKLGDKSPGLVISDEGVFDNTSAVSAGLVPWGDVLEIRETKIANQTFINLVVKNPQEYIDKQKSAFKRKLMHINYDTYGTVIGISANGLKCDYRELKAILDRTFSEFKSRK
jgi:hypothetical protein